VEPYLHGTALEKYNNSLTTNIRNIASGWLSGWQEVTRHVETFSKGCFEFLQ